MYNFPYLTQQPYLCIWKLRTNKVYYNERVGANDSRLPRHSHCCCFLSAFFFPADSFKDWLFYQMISDLKGWYFAHFLVFQIYGNVAWYWLLLSSSFFLPLSWRLPEQHSARHTIEERPPVHQVTRQQVLFLNQHSLLNSGERLTRCTCLWSRSPCNILWWCPGSPWVQ